MNTETIRSIPKVELHCHLDGSICPETLRKLAGNQEIREADVRAPVPCESLAQYLKCFDTVLPLLQTEEALSLAAEDLIRQAAEETVLYIEVRFAPAFHCRGTLTQADACRAVLRGLRQGEETFHVKSRVILCMMRGISEEENQETLECAVQLRDAGVAALDLAGDEAAYPTRMYEDLFRQAADRGIPYTIHSGECGSAENVRAAVEMGAARVGHGVAAAGCPSVLELCRNTCFEMCPISNLQTRAVADLGSHPFLSMLNAGFRVTVNTDNRTVSGTSLTREWETLSRQFPEIDENTILRAGLHAAQAAFLPEEEKNALVKKLREWPKVDISD